MLKLVVATVSFVITVSASGSSPSSSNSTTNDEISPCLDKTPFQMNYSNYWRCISDSFNCYNEVIQQAIRSIRSSECRTKACLEQPATDYGAAVKKVLVEAVKKSSPKAQREWPEELNYAANVIIQEAQRCKIDYTMMMSLFDAAMGLFEKRLESVNQDLLLSDTLQSLQHGGSSPSPFSHQQSNPNGQYQ